MGNKPEREKKKGNCKLASHALIQYCNRGTESREKSAVCSGLKLKQNKKTEKTLSLNHCNTCDFICCFQERGMHLVITVRKIQCSGSAF